MGSVATTKEKVKGKDEEFSLDGVLASAAAPKDKKGKSSVPVLSVPKEVQDKVARLRTLKEELDSASSMFDALSAELVQDVAPLRAELCAKGHVSAVKVPGSGGTSVKVSWSSNYSKTGMENADTIIDAIGDDRFDEFFSMETSISVRDDISEEMLTELIERVGPKEFAVFFEVNRFLKPVPRYTTEFFNAFSPEERERLAQVVKQHKPSVRTK